MGGTYTQFGDYFLPNLKLPEEEQQPIGIWGQRHRRYLKEYRRVTYATLLTSGKLHGYLADLNEQAEDILLLHFTKNMFYYRIFLKVLSHSCCVRQHYNFIIMFWSCIIRIEYIIRVIKWLPFISNFISFFNSVNIVIIFS